MVAGIKVEEEIIRDLERLGIEFYVSGQQGYWASLRIEPDLISRIKEAQKEDSEIWTIVENLDKQVDFCIDDDNVLWQDTRLTIVGVYLAERLNTVLRDKWKSFAGQNYFAYHGVFLSVLWSGPLLIFATLILDQQALHSTTLKTWSGRVGDVVAAWAGRVGDVVAAQPKFVARCKANSEAIYETYGGAGVLNYESLYVKKCKY
nr:transmembrane protein 18 [Tanacetum cinerariifolium]